MRFGERTLVHNEFISSQKELSLLFVWVPQNHGWCFWNRFSRVDAMSFSNPGTAIRHFLTWVMRMTRWWALVSLGKNLPFENEDGDVVAIILYSAGFKRHAWVLKKQEHAVLVAMHCWLPWISANQRRVIESECMWPLWKSMEDAPKFFFAPLTLCWMDFMNFIEVVFFLYRCMEGISCQFQGLHDRCPRCQDLACQLPLAVEGRVLEMALTGDARDKQGNPNGNPAKSWDFGAPPSKKKSQPRHVGQLKKTQMCRFFPSGRQGVLMPLGLGFACDLCWSVISDFSLTLYIIYSKS